MEKNRETPILDITDPGEFQIIIGETIMAEDKNFVFVEAEEDYKIPIDIVREIAKNMPNAWQQSLFKSTRKTHENSRTVCSSAITLCEYAAAALYQDGLRSADDIRKRAIITAALCVNLIKYLPK